MRFTRFLFGLLLAIAMYVETGHAQRVEARLDLDRRDPQPQYIEYVSADGGLVTLGNQSRKSSRYIGITKYNDAFVKEWSKPVLEQNGNNRIELLAVLGEDIYVFISEYVPRDRMVRTSYSRFDLDGNELDHRKLISELPSDRVRGSDLKYERSINKKRLLCYKNPDDGNKQERIFYYLFDANSDEVTSSEIKIPYPDDKFQVRKFMVSNNGQIYVLGKFFVVNRVKSPNDFGFKIYQFEPGKGEGKEASINLGELYITDLTLKIDRDDNLFLAGFYSHRSTDQIIGTCFFRLNQDLEQEVQSAQRFNDDFLNKFLREKQIDRGKELQNFYLDNIILRSDGGVLLLAEKFYVTISSYVDLNGFWVDQKIYHYDEVIVNSVSANGDLEWSAVVPKRQQHERRDFLSYLNVVSGADIFLVFGNYNSRRDPRTLYYNSVSMEGQVSERGILLKNNSFDDSFFPRSSEQISNTEAILVYNQERNKVFSIVKMAFD